MKAIDYLKQVRRIDAMIANKLDQKEQLMSIAMNITSSLGERVQSSGRKEKMADAVIDSVDIERQIIADINRLMLKRNEIICMLEKLDAEEYEMLYKIYVGHVVHTKKGIKTEYATLKEIAVDCGLTRAGADYRHRKALASVQRLLDEKGEV